MNVQHQSMPVAVCALLMAVFAAPLPAAEPDAASVEFFEKKIRPVLVDHCYRCHSAKSEKVKGKFRADSFSALQKGGESGPGVVPGNPDKSLLIEAMLYKNPDLQMPPKEKLPDNVLNDFVEWVKKGATWPSEKEVAVATDEKAVDFDRLRKEHWAFQPIRQLTAPQTKDAAWSADPIDKFVLAKLEEKKLKPGAAADKRALLRRVSFDLTGLPPSPQQIDEFIKDASPDAYEKLVDRLLGSRHFGERWGRHWLDVARYSETAGGGRIVPLSNAWKYREYVINAFNNDKPYDQFIREQIAGDLLPAQDNAKKIEQVTATGFLAIGPKNLDTQDKDLLRMDVVDEQLDTVGKTLMGMTIGCARCHDHKFDPIPTRDYYQMAAIFRSTKTLTPGNVSGVVQAKLPVDPDIQKLVDEHTRKVAALESEIQKLKEMDAPPKAVVAAPKIDPQPKPAAQAGKSKIVDPATLPGIVMDDTQSNIIGTWIRSTHIKQYVGENYIHDNNKSKGELSVSFSPTFPKAGLYEVRMSYTHSPGRDQRVPVIIQCADGEKIVEVNQELEPPIDGLWLSLGKFNFKEGNDGSVTISNAGTKGHVIVDALQFLPGDEATSVAISGKKPADDPAPAPGKPAATQLANGDIKAQLKKLDAELKELKKTGPAAPTTLGVMEEERVGDYNIAIRGDNNRLGEPVKRGFMSFVSYEPPQINPAQSGRLELAQWITDTRNPLPSRVMVNRIWHHLFGAGLVRSVDNFGTTGEVPSHPELLDYLSARFIENGWSVKKIIRSIVLSKTYQLASSDNAAAAKIDPENRLLSRANRRRLDVEAIRDSLLMTSGQLDLSTAAGDPSKTKTLRRTLYMSVERETLDNMLEAFDFADPNLVVGARNTSNIPTQALFLMNSPFVIEHAAKAATRLLAEPDLDAGSRLSRAYLLTLGRLPTAKEQQLSQKFLADAAASGGNENKAWAALCQALYACLDFRFLD